MRSLFATLATVVLAPAASAAEKLNVLFIAVDDLNAWIGALNAHPQAKTPSIDRLASQGMLFTRAYCAAPSCNPSRTALLTGQRPSTTGVYDNNQPWRPVLPDVVTLPEHFRANGYHVAGGGKIFHGGFNDPKAWDTWYRRPPARKNCPTGFSPGRKTSAKRWSTTTGQIAAAGGPPIRCPRR